MQTKDVSNLHAAIVCLLISTVILFVIVVYQQTVYQKESENLQKEVERLEYYETQYKLEHGWHRISGLPGLVPPPPENY